MKSLKKYYLISSFVISIFTFSYQPVYTQSLFDDNNRITIYINPIDSSMYRKGNLLLNESNYYVEIEPGISNKFSLVPLKESLYVNRTAAKLLLGNLVEIDMFNPHNHYSPELSFNEKFIIKCLLLLNFKFNGVIEK